MNQRDARDRLKSKVYECAGSCIVFHLIIFLLNLDHFMAICQ